MALSIELCGYNNDGLYAGIADGGLNEVPVVINARTRNVESVCRQAAQRLRLLADAFDALATMDDPRTEKSHRAALKAARQAAKKNYK